jgi:hypothetical protein
MANEPARDQVTDEVSRTIVSQRTIELLTGISTLVFAVVIMRGAMEHDAGWDDRGPQPGAFPFWVGAVVAIGSIGALAESLWRYRGATDPSALTLAQGRRIAAFLLPMLAFLAVCLVLKLGLYVATVLYLAFVMIWQGRYPLHVALAVSLGTTSLLYVMFDVWLKVPLMKGPLEAWIGVY